MRVLHINALDSGGGAARAAVRLVAAVRQRGIDASLLVQRRTSDDPRILGPESLGKRLLGRAAPILDALIVDALERRRAGLFSPALRPDLLARRVAQLDPDVVHLHWVAFGMLRIETLRRLRRPIVWTLHDSWAFTGGCHVPFDFSVNRPCARYEDACGRCPVLRSDRDHDLSRRVWSRKRDAWSELDLTVVAPSRWLTRCARSSSLLGRCRVETIPNGLELGRWEALDQLSARASLGLPLDKKLVVFGAHGGTTDSNKGFSRLAAALRALRDHPVGKDLELVVFGAGAPPAAAEVSCKATYLGWLSADTTLNRVYAAADVVVVPSLLENLPFAVMEAMASGTPTVAFRQGGVPDLVDHLENGYLAEPYDLGDLAKGIAWVLAAPSERVRASARAKVASTFNARDMAERYADLYREVIASRGRASPCGS